MAAPTQGEYEVLGFIHLYMVVGGKLGYSQAVVDNWADLQAKMIGPS